MMARRCKWRIDGHMCETWFRARVVEYRVEAWAAKFAGRRNNLGPMANNPESQS